jgi:hypothetical protein
VSTGILIATGLAVAQSTTAGGDTATLTISHGASPSTADYIGAGISVPGPSGNSAQLAIMAEYGTTFAAALPAFTVGVAVQINLGMFSANGTIVVPTNGAQLNVREEP